jgi:hypothetical protein
VHATRCSLSAAAGTGHALQHPHLLNGHHNDTAAVCAHRASQLVEVHVNCLHGGAVVFLAAHLHGLKCASH